jgi:hypothetical protein
MYRVHVGNNNLLQLINVRTKQAILHEKCFAKFVRTLASLTDEFLPTPLVVRTELARNGVKYRASCDYMGGVWRDWVRIKWEGYGSLPSKVWGFVDFSNIDRNNRVCWGGVPRITPGIYAIVENAEEIQPQGGEFKSKIFTYVEKEVGKMSNNRVEKLKFYLADVEAFDEPIVVVPDIGGPGNAYLLMNSRGKWGEDFGQWLLEKYEPMQEIESDDESCEELDGSNEESKESSGELEESSDSTDTDSD